MGSGNVRLLLNVTTLGWITSTIEVEGSRIGGTSLSMASARPTRGRDPDSDTTKRSVGPRPGSGVLALAQLYRDRADCENVFDELKNQWGWGGFTTHDLARCKLSARMVALVYNWWNIFVRLAEPGRHLEAITSRPLLLHGIAERTRHARQTKLRIASSHGKARLAERVLTGVARFLRSLVEAAEQLTVEARWARILAHAARAWLEGRQLRAPPRLPAPV